MSTEKQDGKAIEKGDLVAAGQTTALQTASNAAYARKLLESLKEAFLAANAGLDLDFVYMGAYLVMDKKGNFIDHDTKDQATPKSFGDRIDVVIATGEKRWGLWGRKNSPEDGVLICAEKEKENAEAALEAWLLDNPDRATAYSIADLELRYLAYVIPVASLGPDKTPDIYMVSMSPTNTIAWGKYAKMLYDGKFPGIAKGTGANQVVTRLITSEKKSKDNEWLGIDFEAVGLFNPSDYGITV